MGKFSAGVIYRGWESFPEKIFHRRRGASGNDLKMIIHKKNSLCPQNWCELIKIQINKNTE